jgi:uncharacterized protein (UPF0332 family)
LSKDIPKDFSDCRFFEIIVPHPVNMEEVDKDISEARVDLSVARDTLAFVKGDGKHKWVISQAYYSMYLSARAALLSRGFRVKKYTSHICLYHFLNRLKDQGLLESVYANDFSTTMDSRGQANYSGVYTGEDAKKAIQTAESFVERMEKLITQKKL